jgi:hypothetical protein
MKLTTIIIDVAWTLTFGGDVEMEVECRTFEIKFQGLETLMRSSKSNKVTDSLTGKTF